MNFFNKIEQEELISKNDKLKNCYEKCIKNVRDEYIIKDSYKIKNKTYNDFDDLKYNYFQYKCYNECMNNLFN